VIVRPRPRLAAVAGLALAAAVAAGCGQAQPMASERKGGGAAATAAASPLPTDTPQAQATPAPPVRHLPARLVIPSIGVDAPVEAVGRDRNNNMAVPSVASHVAWYSPGPAPGETGDAVIDGHLDWTTGPAVFWNLGKLKAGDEIRIVAQDGAVQRFGVTRAQRVSYTAPPPGLFVSTGAPRLSLITCAGSWDTGKKTYNQRLVVDSQPM
jgi:LPXTG-site transpeptidase (sortase) family protein